MTVSLMTRTADTASSDAVWRLGAALLAAAATDESLRYRIKPLREHMFAPDINNLGAVAGTVKSRGGITLGAVWRDGELQWLPSAPGDTKVAVNTINDRGDAVGQGLGPDRIVRPVLFRDGALVELLFSPSRTPAHGAATNINHAGIGTVWIHDGRMLTAGTAGLSATTG